MLGLLLAFVLVFAYWLHTPHQLGMRWNAVDRGLDLVDLSDDEFGSRQGDRMSCSLHPS